jgi:hypothetical protein
MMSRLFKNKRNAKITPSVVVVEEAQKIEDREPLTMRVVKLHDLFKRYGGQRRPKIDTYSVLKESNELVEFRYVPTGSTIIYVSHEWAGTDHPDPDGQQMYHLLLLLERLQKKKVSRVDMEWFHMLVYMQKYSTEANEWSRILNPLHTYLWYDGFCAPRDRKEDMLRSIPYYIQRCHFTVILVPGCTHFDRIDPQTKRKMNLCYRTYRKRAECVFDMFASLLMSDGSKKLMPMLLVRSGTGTPDWVSPLECQKLAVGNSVFTCCEHNHEGMQTCTFCLSDLSRALNKLTFTANTLTGYRDIAVVNLKKMIEIRSASLFHANRCAEARLTCCLAQWWLRDLSNYNNDKDNTTILNFKTYKMRWNEALDKTWFDRSNFSILFYASVSNRAILVQDLLRDLSQTCRSRRRRHKCVESKIPITGLPSLGFTGCMTALQVAMVFASVEIVTILLEHGSNPRARDIVGNDAYMLGSFFGRTRNVEFWLKRFPRWNVNAKNRVVGGNALMGSIFLGPRKLAFLKMLLQIGASLQNLNDMGGTILHVIGLSEDCDCEALQLVLKQAGSNLDINLRSRGSIVWRLLHSVSRFFVWTSLSKSGLIRFLAQNAGSTPLHHAVRRGDFDVINLLLRYGADPSIRDDMDRSAVDYCDAFPELRGALKRVIQQNKKNNTSLRKTAMFRRDSTATEMKFLMYLVPLDQLHRLYGGKDPRHERIEAHQELKQRGELVRWEDLPFDANIIFLSHEWVGWSHPDPHGIQLKTFLKVLKRLQSGEISQVEMNVFHTMMYKTNLVMKADEWKEMLSTAYVWIDWASMPQPSACPPSVPKDEKKKMGTDLGNAVKSIPAYVIFTHTHNVPHKTKTREQIRRKSRFRCDRGPGMPSRRSKRPRHETSNQDMLSNVQKSRMVCPGNDVFDA